MKYSTTAILSLFLLAISGALQAEDYTFSSPKEQATLLELYTSEGCSSCPQADRWLSGLRDRKDLWKTLVPVAFHVDYWDYIGWKDRFAQKQFSQRQRQHAFSGNIQSVYTPGFVKNGLEWRRWFRSKTLDQAPAVDVGILSITKSKQHISSTFRPHNPKHNSLTLNIALLGFDIKTQVKAGENEDKLLKHDFVVLKHITQKAITSSGYFSWETNIRNYPIKNKVLGIAAWVTPSNSLVPIQTTGGRIPE